MSEEGELVMAYVLTYTRPDGTSVTLPPVTNVVDAGGQAFRILTGEARQFLTWSAAHRYREILVAQSIRQPGTSVRTSNDWTFRIDEEES